MRVFGSWLNQSPRFLSIEFGHFDTYDSRYRELGLFLKRSAVTPAEDHLRALRLLLEKRPPRAGSLSVSDTLFLGAITTILSPRRVVEVGTGTGFSAAVMASMLARPERRSRATLIDSIDAHTCYRTDQSVAIGADLPDLIPDVVDAVRLSRAATIVFRRATGGGGRTRDGLYRC